jgi:tetratricopeptide (TPR) repeat protein
MDSLPRCISRGLALVLICTVCGCATPPLHTARGFFYTGQPERGAAILTDAEAEEQDQVLLLMERGAMWQAAGEFEKSSKDLIAAAAGIERFETLSLSSGMRSMVINDKQNRYIGYPFERVLLHNLTALNHLSSGERDRAGVEGRRALKALDQISGKYPDVPFGWYMTGLCLELADDKPNAVNAYQKARKGVPGIPDPIPDNQEVVYIFLLGRAPSAPYASTSSLPPPEVTIEAGDQPIAQAVLLGDTHELMIQSARAQAAKKALKTLGRIATKEVIAQALEDQFDEEVVGDLARIILIGILERPDDRNWRTLPHWLMVARAPLDSDPSTIRARLNGRRLIKPLTPPIRYGNTWFCFSRVLN